MDCLNVAKTWYPGGCDGYDTVEFVSLYPSETINMDLTGYRNQKDYTRQLSVLSRREGFGVKAEVESGWQVP